MAYAFEMPIDRVDFDPHQYLARSDDLPEIVYRIDSGWACRFTLFPDGRSQITALYLPGDICEPQWLFGLKTGQSIMALTRVRATAMPRADVLSSREIWASVASALARQNEWLVALGRKTAQERIAHLFCEIHDRLHERGLAFDQQCAMPLTQLHIADITGLTAVHVNRTLQELRKRKLITVQSKWLIIHDLPALRSTAGISLGTEQASRLTRAAIRLDDRSASFHPTPPALPLEELEPPNAQA